MRQKIIVGNWKMNPTLEKAHALLEELSIHVMDRVEKNTTVILCPPFPYLQLVQDKLKTVPYVKLGAQDCSAHSSGAYTGEVSASMIKSLGGAYVLLGHSERRKYAQETGAVLAQKIDSALAGGLTPIYCCGEPFDVRASQRQEEYVMKQIEEGLFHLNDKAVREIIVAYEPVWAIGSGDTATPQQAQDMHVMIRDYMASKFGNDVTNRLPILYGGSVKPDNAKELFTCSDVDGGLVGGASLKSDDLLKIIESA